MMYKIGEFSKITNIPIKTIRKYDKEEILLPRCVDIYSKYRYYDEGSIKQSEYIDSLIKLGFSIDEIKSIITYGMTEDIIYNKIDELQNIKKEIENKIENLYMYEEILDNNIYTRKR